jgi:hypothetical protein
MAIYTVTISQKIFEQAKVEADTESEAIALVSENREDYDWELFYSTDFKIIEAKNNILQNK